MHNLPGNSLIKKSLLRMLEERQVPNTLLFAGPESAKKELFALALAKELMGPSHVKKIESGSHPDLHIYHPEGKIGMHSMESMLELIEQAVGTPFEAPCKVLIIHDAERMLPMSSNALLKTLEEPSYTTYILLLSSDPDQILPTILSRCRTLAFSLEGLEVKAPDNELLFQILSSEPSLDYPQLTRALTQLEESLGDGESSFLWLKQVDSLFEQILCWHRDLHLLQLQADPSRLFYPSRLEALQERLKLGSVPPLEKTLERVAASRLAIQRSVKLRVCLEPLLQK